MVTSLANSVSRFFRMTDDIVILCTCSSHEDADTLSHLLVEERLAACVNAITGVRSTYRWKDAVDTAHEVLLLIKTSRALYSAVEQRILAAHSYQLPEVIALPIEAGSEPYLAWLRANLKGAE